MGHIQWIFLLSKENHMFVAFVLFIRVFAGLKGNCTERLLYDQKEQQVHVANARRGLLGGAAWVCARRVKVFKVFQRFDESDTC